MRLGDDPVPQIPWAQHTKVLKGGHLQSGTLEVYVSSDGDLTFSRDSRADILMWMSKDEALTEQIQEAWEEHYDGQGYTEFMTTWIRGTAERPPGVKEWRPGGWSERRGKVIRSGNTYNFDNAYWWGSVFEYVWFQLPDGEEGLVVMWQRGGDVRGNYSLPEVWIGSVEEFFGNQEEGDPHSAETAISYNAYFENGILWMLDQLDYFEDYEIDEDSWIAQALERDPDLIWPELLVKLEALEKEMPKGIVKAIRSWKDRRQLDAEKASGQGYFWPGLYPREESSRG